jgi:hypothetical protein
MKLAEKVINSIPSASIEKYKQLKQIVDDKSMGKVDGVKVDLTTASLMLQVADTLKPENKEKFLSMPIKKMIDVTFKLMGKNESKAKIKSEIDQSFQSITESSKTMLDSYLETALWSSNDLDDKPLDSYSISDIAASSIKSAKADLDSFVAKAGDILDNYDDKKIGHDFWLTRNGHGAGFWDGDYEENEGDGDKLTEISKEFSELNPYVGDDGKVYIE